MNILYFDILKLNKKIGTTANLMKGLELEEGKT